jgi:hypothetical protein
VLLLETPDDLVWVQADALGIGAHERPSENASWPARDIVGLEALEQGD